MSYYRDNLQTMQGRVRQYKPNASPEQARTWINDALNDLYTARTLGWSDTILTTTVQIPNITASGTISVTQGTNVVTGAGTTWPVNDVVNTTLLSSIQRTGNVDFQVATAQQNTIQTNSILLIDAGTPSQETVAIRYRQGDLLTGYFQYRHNSGATVTQSSLVNLQFLLGTSFPIFNVLGVVSSTQLIVDVIWNQATQTGLSYQIVPMYTPVVDRCRHVKYALDQFQGITLRTELSRQFIDNTDPQRSSPGDPLAVVSYGRNANGNWIWELWPAPTTPRTLSVVCNQGFQYLLNADDRGPDFIDPAIIVKYAAASALRTRVSMDDKFYDPKLSQILMMEYERDKERAIDADEARCIQMYSNIYDKLIPGFNANYWLSHDIDAVSWSF